MAVRIVLKSGRQCRCCRDTMQRIKNEFDVKKSMVQVEFFVKI